MCKRKIKFLLRNALKVWLSGALALMPVCGWGANPSDEPLLRFNGNQETPEEPVLPGFKDTPSAGPMLPGFKSSPLGTAALQSLPDRQNLTPKQIAVIEKFNHLMVAFEEGRGDEYIRNNPLTEDERDYFLLAGQQVELVSYRHDYEQNKVVEEKSKPVSLNTIDSIGGQPDIRDLKVRYDSQTKKLAFEGISQGKVVIRQFVPGMDVISSDSDQELMALLDKDRGLFLLDKIFTRVYLGMAPVPLTRIPRSEALKSALSENQNIQVEILSFAKGEDNEGESPAGNTTPPDRFHEEVTNLSHNLNRDFIFKSGDLMITHTDSTGQKHLLQYVSQREMMMALDVTYEIVDFMTRIINKDLVVKNLKGFEEEVQDLIKRGGPTLDQHIVSTLFVKPALGKLSNEDVLNGISKRREQMARFSDRDQLLLSEWRRNFTQGRESLEHHLKQAAYGVVPTSSARGEGDGSPQQEAGDKASLWKKAKARTLKTLGFFAKHKKKSLAAAAGSLTLGLDQALPEGLNSVTEPVLRNFLYLFPHLKSLFVDHISQGGDSFAFTIMPHIVFGLTVIPAALILPTVLYVPSAYAAYALLPNTVSPFKHLPFVPESVRDKTFHPKGAVRDSIDRWFGYGKWLKQKWFKGQNKTSAGVFQRYVGVGLKVAAPLMLLFYRLPFYLTGQRSFFSALQKGLNPFEVIKPDSDIGKLLNLRHPERLGLNWPPVYGRVAGSQTLQNKQRLQTARQLDKQRINQLAWVMAHLAAANKESIHPGELMVRGVLTDMETVGRVQNDKNLKADMRWVMHGLIREITLSGQVDITKHSIDINILLAYYEKAKQLAREVKTHTMFRRAFRSFIVNSPFIVAVKRYNLAHWAGLNMKEYSYLTHSDVDAITSDRAARSFGIDQAETTFTTPFVTERGAMGLARNHQLAIGEGRAFMFQPEYLSETLTNVGLHNVMASRTFLLYHNPLSNIENLNNAAQLPHAPREEEYFPVGDTSRGKNPQPALHHFKNAILYSFAMGKEGHFMSYFDRQYWAMTKMLQIYVALYVVMRVLPGIQSPMDALKAALFWNLIAVWGVGSFWAGLEGSTLWVHKFIEKNIKKMKNLVVRFSRINREHFQSEGELHSWYEGALRDTLSLYLKKPDNYSDHVEDIASSAEDVPGGGQKEDRLKTSFVPGQLKSLLSHSELKEVNPQLWEYLNSVSESSPKDLSFLEGLPVSQDLETVKKTSRFFMRLISEKPPLYDRFNKIADSAGVTLMVALITSFTGTAIYTRSFEPEWISWPWLATYATVHFPLLYGLNKLYDGQGRKFKGFFQKHLKRLAGSSKNWCRNVFSGS